MISKLEQNYQQIQEDIAKACAACGRKREDVTLVAVSKFHPADAIAEIAKAGQIDFGENYLQEAEAKMSALQPQFPDLRWHMIGHVQSRKAPLVAGNFALIHTLDSRKLADGLERKLVTIDKKQPVLIELNIADEPQKSGIMEQDLSKITEYVLKNCPHLELKGLMCLPPVFDSGNAARPYFAKLRNLRDNLEKEFQIPLPELSMGMSGDYSGAIAEGATIIRIGTIIFGERPKKEARGSNPA